MAARSFTLKYHLNFDSGLAPSPEAGLSLS